MTVHKDYWDLSYPETFLVGNVCGLYLEGISVRHYPVEANTFKHLPPEPFKAAGGVCNRQPCYKIYIFGRKFAEQQPLKAPVEHPDSSLIAAADDKVIIFKHLKELWKFSWIMGHVSIHLEYIFYTVFECVFEPLNVGA